MYHSYKDLFKIEFKIYNIGTYSLPKAIPLDGCIVFAACWVPAKIICTPLASIIGQPQSAVTIALDMFMTLGIMKCDPQGRSFLGFIFDFLMFLIRNKTRDFTGRSLPKHRGMYLDWESYDIGA